jgi:hypothetical protein
MIAIAITATTTTAPISAAETALPVVLESRR